MKTTTKLDVEQEEMDLIQKAMRLKKQNQMQFVSYSAIKHAREVLQNES